MLDFDVKKLVFKFKGEKQENNAFPKAENVHRQGNQMNLKFTCVISLDIPEHIDPPNPEDKIA